MGLEQLQYCRASLELFHRDVGGVGLRFYPAFKRCLQNEMQMLPSEALCSVIHTPRLDVRAIFASTCHHPGILPIHKAFRLISQLFFTFRRRLEVRDLPRLLESPPGVDTVAALPAPEIPPSPGVPDQTSSSGLEAEKNYNENHQVGYCVAESIW